MTTSMDAGRMLQAAFAANVQHALTESGNADSFPTEPKVLEDQITRWAESAERWVRDQFTRASQDVDEESLERARATCTRLLGSEDSGDPRANWKIKTSSMLAIVVTEVDLGRANLYGNFRLLSEDLGSPDLSTVNARDHALRTLAEALSASKGDHADLERTLIG